MDKRAILDAVRALLARDHATMLQAAEATRAGATHEEARPENDKDTRAIEASYLARGQAQRVEELGEALTRLALLPLRDFAEDDELGLTALLRLELEGEAQPYWLFILPVAGGLEVEVCGERIRTLTPSAPLGRALIGRCCGECFELPLRGQKREYELIEVR